MNEKTKHLIERLGCNYTLFEKGTSPAAVERAYKAALEVGKENGFWPAIVSGKYLPEWLGECVGADYDKDAIIAGCGDNGRDILQKDYAGLIDIFAESELEDFIGEETEGDVIHHFCSYCLYKDNALDADTLLLELPVKNPWEIIAWIPIGGWNECPAPEDMIAVCKYWYEKYRAVPAAFTGDVMEFYAPMKLNGMDSMEAAKEHYAFCTDRIEQGTRTYKLSELAAGLKESTVWYFWWD